MSGFIEEMIGNSPKWIFKEVSEEKMDEFSRMTVFSRRISKILLLRGVKTEGDLKHYLQDDIYNMHNPFRFSQMLQTVVRVKRAIHSKERIFIFGDRDVDGVLSTAMMYNVLKRFDADVLCKVPEGEYGYGIEIKDIDYAKSRGVSLIITVDTGISSREEVDYARSLGIDTIIIDHHIQPDVVPPAFSILNPKMKTEEYPFKDLSAGGVVLKFIHAFTIAHTKNFNRVFVPVMKDGELIRGIMIRNGLLEDSFTIEESIHYPIEDTFVIVSDAGKPLPGYFTQWLKDNKINQISIVSSQPYESIEEFAVIFIGLYLKRQKKSMKFLCSFIDLSAISTISDIMPLTGENRIIVKEGLRQINSTDNLGLRTLLDYCDLDEKGLTARDVAWNLSPIINSAGRMGDASIAVKLFTTYDIQKANEMSRILIKYNEKRKEKGERNLSIIRPIVEDKYYRDPVIVLSTDEAEHGVTGIIASKIARKFSKPTIIIVSDGHIGIGSGRGGENFDLVALVSRCDDLLVKYGGHKSAVGFTIDTSKIALFRKRIHEIVQNELDLFKCEETLEIDDTILPEDITFEFYNDLSVFEPTGTGNTPPLFSIIGTTATNPVPIGKDRNHIKFFIPARTGLIPVIGWGLADKGFRILEESTLIDIVFSIEDNIFKGERTLQLILSDMRSSGLLGNKKNASTTAG